jgi:hypothetical protein
MKTLSAIRVRSRRLSFSSIIRIGIFPALIALIAIPFYSTASVSIKSKLDKKGSTIVSQVKSPSGAPALKATRSVSAPVKESFNPFLLTPFAGETIETFAADCTTPQTSFAVGDTVCVKVSGIPVDASFPRRVLLGNANSTVIQSFNITSDPQTFTFVVAATSVIGGNTVDNRGSWRGIVQNPFFYFPESDTAFSVNNPADLTADAAVTTSDSPGDVQAGTAITFQLQVKNYGPDSATTVQLTNDVPANTTFVDFQQVTGPTFTCSTPTVGSTGTTTCSIASLVWPGPAAEFVATYMVNAGTPANTAIVNTANLSSTTNDQNTANNTTTDTATVVTTPTGQNCSFTCPENIVATATSPSGAIVNFASAINIEGDCGSISASPSSGSLFPVGVTTVNVTSTAPSAPSCSFTVTVVDTPAPTISCPADQTVTDTDGDGFENVTVGTPTTSPTTGVTVVGRRSDDIPATYDDDGNVVTPEVIVPLTDPYPVGATGITWTVTDEFGRTATCTQRIVVVANNSRAPVTITCPANVTANSPSSCQSTIPAATIGTPTTVPSDSNVVVTAQRADGLNLTDPFPSGNTIITWTATDNLTGNVASCTQTVTLNTSGAPDNVPPNLHVPQDVTTTTASCSVVLDDELGVATAEDNCTASVNVVRTGVPANFIFPTGTTVITYTATDAAGNVATGTQLITVTESPAIPPTITAPGPVNVSTGPGATSCGTFVSDAALGSATANDNCPGVIVTRSGVPAGNMFPVGITTVTYTATDKSGNIATDTQLVTVVDNTPPVVTPPAAVTLFTGTGATSCGVTVSNLDATLGTGSATDNCPGVGAVTRSGVPAGNVFPLGQTILTYSATDVHGNTGSATQTVTVVDNTPPVISCPANITLEPTCPTGAIATWTPPVGTDNCAGAVTTRTGPAPGSVFPIGTTTVTYTVTDANGNPPVSCSFTVTIKTPQTVIQDLQASVSASNLTGTQKNGLLSKLSAALQGLNSGQTNVACNKLSDFINSVQTLVSHGDLSSATGNAWITSANHVRNTIGCTNLPCS